MPAGYSVSHRPIDKWTCICVRHPLGPICRLWRLLRDKAYMCFWPSKLELMVQWAYAEGKKAAAHAEHEHLTHHGYLDGLKAGREQALEDFQQILRKIDGSVEG